ncbi:thioesterase [Dactylosporangium roseum]|uniref:Thioesterase n=1 Tax=Dactylosporangium roseum TaxID=47989 RepID=A0ABY5ZBI3_9ACTN|nr:alpha/beta fold hydrolase [Dactylosporangium roseum]UWZ39414.1 thioesterase [Dactylosporangium roseum]
MPVEPQVSRWLLRCGGSTTPRWRLLCLAYAGAGASCFRDWRLPPDLCAEVWAAQLPGREGRWREPALRRVGDVVERLCVEVLPLLDVPLAVFGHSYGALLAFEIARALRRAGAPQPAHLFVSGHRAPDLPPWRPAASTLPMPRLLDRLAEMAGPSQSVVNDPELLTVLAPMLRADLEACETYRYRPETPLDTPLTCFGAIDDCEVRMDEITAWDLHTSRRWRVRSFTGGHLFLHDRRDGVIATIAAHLAETRPAAERAW